MSSARKVLIPLIFGSLLAIYIFLLFFQLRTDLFVIIVIYCILFGVLFVSLLIFAFLKMEFVNKLKILIPTLLLIVFFFIGYGLLGKASHYIFYYSIKNELNELVSKIKTDEITNDNFINERYKNEINKLGFVSIEFVEDATILTQGGFLDNCYGIAFSETGTSPESNTCGTIVIWEKITDNWYYWTTT